MEPIDLATSRKRDSKHWEAKFLTESCFYFFHERENVKIFKKYNSKLSAYKIISLKINVPKRINIEHLIEIV